MSNQRLHNALLKYFNQFDRIIEEEEEEEEYNEEEEETINIFDYSSESSDIFADKIYEF